MHNKEGLFQNRALSALLIIVISVSILFFYRSDTGTNVAADNLTTPIDMEPIDSSGCIACHADANIITSLAVVTDASDHAAEGG